MSTPISVAMATCNGEQYIRVQIASLLRQQLRPAEIVVCDDASTDGTMPILAEYEARGLIRLYKNETRLGVMANFKRAVSLCAPGHWVALCDQDDCWHADKLAENAALLATMDNSKAGLVFSDLSLVDETLEEIGPSFWKELNVDPAQENLASLLFGNFITGCTLLMNEEMRKLFAEMPDTGVMMHDAWLGLVAFSFGRYDFSRKPMLQYRQHGSNVTFATNKQSSMVSKLFKNLAQMLNNKQYLATELQLAETFYNLYAARLTPSQKETFGNFLALKSASFFKKKQSALAARAYRNNLKP